MAILTGVRWDLSAALICISSMTRDDEHFFMCLFAICALLEELSVQFTFPFIRWPSFLDVLYTTVEFP
jgi:hypothetical protein